MNVADGSSSEELDSSVPQPPNPVSQASTELATGRDGAQSQAPPPSASFKTNGGVTPELPPSMYPCRAVSVTRTWSGQVTDSGSCYGALPALPSLIPPYKERERDREYDSDENSTAQKTHRSSYRRRILSNPPRLIPSLYAPCTEDDVACVSPTSAHTACPLSPAALPHNSNFEAAMPTVSTFSIADYPPLPLDALHNVVPPPPTVPPGIKSLQSTFCPPPVSLSTPFGDVRAVTATAGTPELSATHIDVSLANFQSSPASTRNCPHVGHSPHHATPSESTPYSSTPGPHEPASENLPRKHDSHKAAPLAGAADVSMSATERAPAQGDSVVTAAVKSKSTNLESFLAASVNCDAAECRPGVPDMLDDAERTVKRFCITNRAAVTHMFTVDFMPPSLQHAMRELSIQLGFSRRSTDPLMPPLASASGTPRDHAAGDADANAASFLRLGSLFRSDTGITEGDELRLRPVVFYSLSHHRVQHLFWKDIDCTCVCIPEDAEGHPDLEILDAQLQRHSASRLLLAIFPAASVATGALTDVATLCEALHRRGALAAIDYATPRAPAAAVAAAGCFHGRGRKSPDAAIVSAGALTGASEAAYALVYCQAGIAESSMMAPPAPTESFMQEPSPFRTLSCEVPTIHTQASKPPLPPPHPTTAAVASATHILDYHLSTDMHAVTVLCSAYAERARTVWGLCPAVILVRPNSNSRGATAKFPVGVPPRNPPELHGVCPNGDDIDFDQLVSISAVPSPTKGAAGQSPQGVLGAGMYGDVQSRITAFAAEQLPSHSATATSPSPGAAESAAPVSSSVSFCMVARCGQLALAGEQDALQSPGVEEVLPFERQLLSHQFVAAVLRDMYGIQVTCVSALSGPFGLPLLEPLLATLNAPNAHALQKHLFAARALPEPASPPGWCQVHFSHLMQPYEVDYVIRAVAEAGAHAWKLLPQYRLDAATGEFYHHSRTRKALKDRVPDMGKAAKASASPAATPPQHCQKLEVLSSGSAGLIPTVSDPRMSVGACGGGISSRSGSGGGAQLPVVRSTEHHSVSASRMPEFVGPEAVTVSDFAQKLPGEYSSDTSGMHDSLHATPQMPVMSTPERPQNRPTEVKQGITAMSSCNTNDGDAHTRGPSRADSNMLQTSMPSTVHPCSARDMETMQTTPTASQGHMATISSLNHHSTLPSSTSSSTCAPAAVAAAAAGPSGAAVQVQEQQDEDAASQASDGDHLLSPALSISEGSEMVSANSEPHRQSDPPHRSIYNAPGFADKSEEFLRDSGIGTGLGMLPMHRRSLSNPSNPPLSPSALAETAGDDEQEQQREGHAREGLLQLHPEVGSVDSESDSESLTVTPHSEAPRSALRKTVSGGSPGRNRHIFHTSTATGKQGGRHSYQGQLVPRSLPATCQQSKLSYVAAQRDTYQTTLLAKQHHWFDGEADMQEEHNPCESGDGEPQEELQGAVSMPRLGVSLLMAARTAHAARAAGAQHAHHSAPAQGGVDTPTTPKAASETLPSVTTEFIDASEHMRTAVVQSAAPSAALTPLKDSEVSTTIASVELPCLPRAGSGGKFNMLAIMEAHQAQLAQDSVHSAVPGTCVNNAQVEVFETPEKAPIDKQQEIADMKSPELILGGFPEQAEPRSSSEELRLELAGVMAAATAVFKRVGKHNNALESPAAQLKVMHEDREVEEMAAYYLDTAAAAAAVQRGVDLGAWAFDCTEEEAHNLQKLHLWMRHACLRPRALELPDPNPSTTTGATAAAAVCPEKHTLLAARTLDLSEDKQKKVHESHASDDTSSDALKQVDASVAPVTVSTGRPGVGVSASGDLKRGPKKARENLSNWFLCCFARSPVQDDTAPLLTPP